MARTDDVIREFGRSINVPDLSFNEHGVVDLEIERVGRLFLEKEKEGVLLYLMKEYPRIDGLLCRHALDLCRPEAHFDFPIYTGLIGEDQLIFATRLLEDDLDWPTLGSALDLLESLHNRQSAS